MFSLNLPAHRFRGTAHWNVLLQQRDYSAIGEKVPVEARTSSSSTTRSSPRSQRNGRRRRREPINEKQSPIVRQLLPRET